MSREIDQDQNYAIVILNELRFSKFQFKEQDLGSHKRYTFMVPNCESDSIEPEQNLLSVPTETETGEVGESCQSQKEPETRESVPKNLIKNFICAFTSFLNEAKEETTFLEILKLNKEGVVVINRLRQQLATLHKSKRYNTEMLQTILSVGENRALFQLFLSQKAGKWVSCGRMRNKQAHSSAINYLQDYLESAGEARRLKFNYKRAH